MKQLQKIENSQTEKKNDEEKETSRVLFFKWLLTHKIARNPWTLSLRLTARGNKQIVRIFYT